MEAPPEQEEITLFISDDEEENERARRALSSIPDIRVLEMASTKLLEDYVYLPFIKKADGRRIFGLEAILRFAEGRNGNSRVTES